MPQLLQGRKALVTGAGRGIGVAIAHALAGEGASVALAYRNSRDGAEAAAQSIRDAGGTAVALQADVSAADEAARLVEATQNALGGLDILVNNAAGFGPLQRLEDATWENIDAEWRAVV